MRVIVLGSGDAFGSGGRSHSAYLVEGPAQTFLVDCGPSVLQSLKRAGRDPAAVDFVLLSHLHGDHFGGVPFLFLEYRYESIRTRPLLVCGPVGTERRVRALFAALYEKTASEPLPFPLRFEEWEPGRRRRVGGVDVLPFVVPHAPDLTAFGFRLELDGRAILYSGDSSWTDEFVVQSEGVDLFLCECSHYETPEHPIHCGYEEIAARARQLRCRRLVLSHLGREPVRRRGELTLECAEDGMTIDL